MRGADLLRPTSRGSRSILSPKQSKLTNEVGGIFPYNTIFSTQIPPYIATKAAIYSGI
jgi:hypothetical protein